MPTTNIDVEGIDDFGDTKMVDLYDTTSQPPPAVASTTLVTTSATSAITSGAAALPPSTALEATTATTDSRLTQTPQKSSPPTTPTKRSPTIVTLRILPQSSGFNPSTQTPVSAISAISALECPPPLTSSSSSLPSSSSSSQTIKPSRWCHSYTTPSTLSINFNPEYLQTRPRRNVPRSRATSSLRNQEGNYAPLLTNTVHSSPKRENRSKKPQQQRDSKRQQQNNLELLQRKKELLELQLKQKHQHQELKRKRGDIFSDSEDHSEERPAKRPRAVISISDDEGGEDTDDSYGRGTSGGAQGLGKGKGVRGTVAGGLGKGKGKGKGTVQKAKEVKQTSIVGFLKRPQNAPSQQQREQQRERQQQQRERQQQQQQQQPKKMLVTLRVKPQLQPQIKVNPSAPHDESSISDESSTTHTTTPIWTDFAIPNTIHEVDEEDHNNGITEMPTTRVIAVRSSSLAPMTNATPSSIPDYTTH